MPTYEFECRKCGDVFDEFFHIPSKAPKTLRCQCVGCNGTADRLIGTGYVPPPRRGLHGPERYAELLKRIPDTPDNRKRAQDGEI